MRVILLGAPGAGKGTQAVSLSKKLHIPHISTGDIFRKNIAEGTPVGIRAKQFIDRGMLVPDEITLEIITKRLKQEDCKDGYFLDGFPRTLPQAKALDSHVDIDIVVDIAVDEKCIVHRICGRRSCPECGGTYHVSHLAGDVCPECGSNLIIRKDDNEETVLKRLQVYKQQTEPLIGYYSAKGKLVTVDGNGTPEQIEAAILAELKRL